MSINDVNSAASGAEAWLMKLFRSIIPLTMLNTRVPSQYAIPFAMMIWALFTVLITTATTYRQVWGYRFLVGFGEGESSTYPLLILHSQKLNCLHRCIFPINPLCFRLLVSSR